jgi:hypothetical protein
MNESRIITDGNGLLKQPHDPYWDGALTRREAQIAINEIAMNEAELTRCLDTMSIVMNFLAEKMGVTRGEIDAWVANKKAQVLAAREAAAQAQSAPEGANAQSNS